MAIAVHTDGGQLAAARATIYTCPINTKAYVKLLRLYNTAATTETVNVYVSPGGGAGTRQVWKGLLTTLESAVLGSIGLEANDLLEADTTNAASVDWTLSVVQET